METPVQAPAQVMALFNGCRQVVYGFVPDCTQATLKAVVNNHEISTMVSTPDLNITTGKLLHQLTALAIIQDWSDGQLAAELLEHEILKKNRKNYIINLSIQFSIITQFTSFVAVEKREEGEVISAFTDMTELVEKDSVDILNYMGWEDSKCKITVRSLDHSPFMLEVDLSDTIESVKSKIFDVTSTRGELALNIIADDAKNETILWDYDIKDGSKVYFIEEGLDAESFTDALREVSTSRQDLMEIAELAKKKYQHPHLDVKYQGQDLLKVLDDKFEEVLAMTKSRQYVSRLKAAQRRVSRSAAAQVAQSCKRLQATHRLPTFCESSLLSLDLHLDSFVSYDDLGLGLLDRAQATIGQPLDLSVQLLQSEEEYPSAMKRRSRKSQPLFESAEFEAPEEKILNRDESISFQKQPEIPTSAKEVMSDAVNIIPFSSSTEQIISQCLAPSEFEQVPMPAVFSQGLVGDILPSASQQASIGLPENLPEEISFRSLKKIRAVRSSFGREKGKVAHLREMKAPAALELAPAVLELDRSCLSFRPPSLADSAVYRHRIVDAERVCSPQAFDSFVPPPPAPTLTSLDAPPTPPPQQIIDSCLSFAPLSKAVSTGYWHHIIPDETVCSASQQEFHSFVPPPPAPTLPSRDAPPPQQIIDSVSSSFSSVHQRHSQLGAVDSIFTSLSLHQQTPDHDDDYTSLYAAPRPAQVKAPPSRILCSMEQPAFPPEAQVPPVLELAPAVLELDESCLSLAPLSKAVYRHRIIPDETVCTASQQAFDSVVPPLPAPSSVPLSLQELAVALSEDIFPPTTQQIGLPETLVPLSDAPSSLIPPLPLPTTGIRGFRSEEGFDSLRCSSPAVRRGKTFASTAMSSAPGAQQQMQFFELGAVSTPGSGAVLTPGSSAASTVGFGSASTAGLGVESTAGFNAASTAGLGTASTAGFCGGSATVFDAASAVAAEPVSFVSLPAFDRRPRIKHFFCKREGREGSTLMTDDSASSLPITPSLSQAISYGSSAEAKQKRSKAEIVDYEKLPLTSSRARKILTERRSHSCYLAMESLGEPKHDYHTLGFRHDHQDVILLSIGIETFGKIMTPVLRHYGAIPAVETIFLTTCYDDQRGVRIKVYEGEYPRTEKNYLLGQVELSGILPMPRGRPRIQVVFDVDANYFLTITVTEPSSDQMRNISIQLNKERLSKHEIETMKSEAEKMDRDVQLRLPDDTRSADDWDVCIYGERLGRTEADSFRGDIYTFEDSINVSCGRPEWSEDDWEKLFKLCQEDERWEMNDELGKLLSINASKCMEILVSNGLNSLGNKAKSEIVHLISCILILFRILELHSVPFDNFSFGATKFNKFYSSVKESMFKDDSKNCLRIIRAACTCRMIDQKHPFLYSRLNLGHSWPEAVARLMGKELGSSLIAK